MPRKMRCECRISRVCRTAVEWSASSIVAVTLNAAAIPPIEQFFDIALRDLVQREPQFSRDLCQVPQYVAKLRLQGRPICIAYDSTLVPKDLLDLAGNFSSLV